MTTFHVVTTCSARGWDEYGFRMASSFFKYWPFAQELTFYTEDFTPKGWPSVVTRQLPEWQRGFRAAHPEGSTARGCRRGGYDFRQDAVRFSHKVAAITAAAEEARGGLLVWMDADMTTHQRVTPEFLESLVPPDACLAWFDRAGIYPECGFLAFRVGHPMFLRLMDEFRGAYELGEVFRLPETHDSFVLQHLVEKLHVPWHSLSGHARNSSHPIARGPLAPWFDHRKGARKALDHSPEHAVLK